MQLFQLKDNKEQALETTAKVEGKTLTVNFTKPLPRDTTIRLKVARVAAEDGGFMSKPYGLDFKTSGGPKVIGVNVGNYKVPTTSTFVLSFDSPLLSTADAQKFIRVEVGGRTLGASITTYGSTATVTPNVALPRCTRFTIRISDGIQNRHGIAGGSTWAYNARTICQSVFSIGASAQGRGITAYGFGTGKNVILFVGGTHGDETSSVNILYPWIDTLEAAGHMPGDKTIVVIPNLNPDGYAMGQRTNARNVALNRNFPANNWKRSVKMPNGTTNTNGGGSAPLSELESRALANFIYSRGPSRVLTYHSAAGVVTPNGSGNSSSLARIYDQNSGVYMSSGAGVFEYDTTGAFEDWLHDKVGTPALLIELWSHSGYEFSSHSDAMWAMIR